MVTASFAKLPSGAVFFERSESFLGYVEIPFVPHMLQKSRWHFDHTNSLFRRLVGQNDQKALPFDVRKLLLTLASLLMGLSCMKQACLAQGPPTITEYAAYVGNAEIVPFGRLVIDGYRLTCGRRPTVLDSTLDDYGAAYPGFLILNPNLIAQVPTAVKLWIYSHECGHQFRGPSEEVADCFAVQRGRRQRWLTTEGLDKICKFITPARGSNMHLPGPERCKAMRECYATKKVY
ncbi:MAG: hypothetical protein AAFR90_12630 [Pseudomonadota bacterium]